MNCISEPISHLKLEAWLLGELPDRQRAHVAQHLHQCAACAQCLAEVEQHQKQLVLPSLELPLPAPKPRWHFGLWGLSLSAAAVAIVLLVQRPTDDVLTQRPDIKGGEVVIGLVRERAGVINLDPQSFRDGDRFKVRVTCAATRPQAWDVVTIQDGTPSFPLAGDGLACGNQVTLPGAFALTGRTATRVCLVMGADHESREAIADHIASNTDLPCIDLMPEKNQ